MKKLEARYQAKIHLSQIISMFMKDSWPHQLSDHLGSGGLGRSALDGFSDEDALLIMEQAEYLAERLLKSLN